jgi:hypothetical protein
LIPFLPISFYLLDKQKKQVSRLILIPSKNGEEFFFNVTKVPVEPYKAVRESEVDHDILTRLIDQDKKEHGEYLLFYRSSKTKDGQILMRDLVFFKKLSVEDILSVFNAAKEDVPRLPEHATVTYYHRIDIDHTRHYYGDILTSDNIHALYREDDGSPKFTKLIWNNYERGGELFYRFPYNLLII